MKKLSYEDAQTIRSRHAAGESQNELAMAYEVTQANISSILRNRTHKKAPRSEQEEAEYRADVARRKRESNWKANFGLTPEEYDEMFEAQGGVCGICGNPNEGRGLCVDHDHDTMKVRALLCDPCNKGIGHLRDNPEIVLKAYEYLRRHNNDLL